MTERHPALPVIYSTLPPRWLSMNLRESFRFDRDDIGWLKATVPHCLLGRHVEMPADGTGTN